MLRAPDRLASFVGHPIRGAATTGGVASMSKYKKALFAVAKGEMSQSEIAASLHVSKHDVLAAARVARELARVRPSL